jgi:hypothetical protein
LRLAACVPPPHADTNHFSPRRHYCSLPSFRATKAFPQGLRPRTTFRGYDLCPCNVISSRKQRSLVSAALFYRFSSRTTETVLPRFEPRRFLEVVACVHVVSSLKQTSLVLILFFVLLTVRATETNLTGTRTRDTFSEFGMPKISSCLQEIIVRNLGGIGFRAIS